MGQICHHTTDNRGNWRDIERDGPVLGTSPRNFFGKGYYFWVNNFDRAQFWGWRHYSNSYCIFEGDLEIDKNELFDTTDPNDIAFLKSAANLFFEENVDISLYALSALLSLFFDEEVKKGKTYFPFKYAKGYDNSSPNKRSAQKMWFTPNVSSYIVLNPVVFYCVFKKEDLTLNKFKKVYSR